ncbi:hypothetical protein GEMRC1_003884 [Eukaryota sp. GEM-RC1]
MQHAQSSVQVPAPFFEKLANVLEHSRKLSSEWDNFIRTYKNDISEHADAPAWIFPFSEAQSSLGHVLSYIQAADDQISTIAQPPTPHPEVVPIVTPTPSSSTRRRTPLSVASDGLTDPYGRPIQSPAPSSRDQGPTPPDILETWRCHCTANSRRRLSFLSNVQRNTVRTEYFSTHYCCL